MQLKSSPAQREAFRASCRQHGLRLTPQREVIYDMLCHGGEHPTAEELHRQIRTRYPSMSLDTVNRTLLTFARIGLAEVVEGYGSPRRFDSNLARHHHVHCLRCGMIFDFSNPSYDALEIPANLKKQTSHL